MVSFGADVVVQPGGFYVGYKNHARGDFGFGFGIGDLETVYLRAPDGTLNAMGIWASTSPGSKWRGRALGTIEGGLSLENRSKPKNFCLFTQLFDGCMVHAKNLCLFTQ